MKNINIKEIKSYQIHDTDILLVLRDFEVTHNLSSIHQAEEDNDDILVNKLVIEVQSLVKDLEELLPIITEETTNKEGEFDFQDIELLSTIKLSLLNCIKDDIAFINIFRTP